MRLGSQREMFDTTESKELTERQKREKEYYEQYSQGFDLDKEVDFSPVICPKPRPWNSYWSVYHIAADKFLTGSRLLDFGSGPGDNALRFAKIGYQVEGFDISDSNVSIAKKLFDKYGMQDRGNFVTSPAEGLPYTDDYFDFIAGVDILHHVNIEKAILECKRVLKVGGTAVFREPLEVPFVDYIRNLGVVKMIAPKEKSFEHHITEDERKLNQQDIEIIEKIFPDVAIFRYFFLARLDRFFRKGSDPAPSMLERIDHILFKVFPPLKYLGGVVIFKMTKKS